VAAEERTVSSAMDAKFAYFICNISARFLYSLLVRLVYFMFDSAFFSYFSYVFVLAFRTFGLYLLDLNLLSLNS
jgi:hypothetical protein